MDMSVGAVRGVAVDFTFAVWGLPFWAVSELLCASSGSAAPMVAKAVTITAKKILGFLMLSTSTG